MKRNMDTTPSVSRTQAEAVLALHRRIAALLRAQQKLRDLLGKARRRRDQYKRKCIAAYGNDVLSRDRKERIGE